MDPEPEHDVGRTLPVTALLAAGTAMAVIALGVLWYLMAAGAEPERTVVMATGPVTGSYHGFGVELGRLLEAEGIVDRAEVRPTDGSVANMAMIGGRGDRADLAVVQSDTPAAETARLVALLYEEHLHVLVTKGLAEEIRTVQDLNGRTVSLGSAGSGTREVAERVLEHFRIEVGEDLAIPPEEVVEGLVDGTVEAAFLVAAVPSATVDRLCERDAVRFLGLGDAQERGNAADALALVHPTLRAATIPHSAYGLLPQRAVLTVSVSAQLIAADDLDAALVRRVTEALFQNRSRFGAADERLALATRIRERYDPGAATLPYHPGAVAFYLRQQPPFLVEYAEAISLGLTVLVGLYSGYIALREWARRRRKNRIDEFYVEATRHFIDVRNASPESLIERREALVALRHRAFVDLVNERLQADESFRILQDQIDSELRTIEALIGGSSP